MDAHLPIDNEPPVGAAALVAAAGAAIPLATTTHIPLVNSIALAAAAVAGNLSLPTIPINPAAGSGSVDGKDVKKQHSELQKWAIIAECLCNYDWKKERLRDNAAQEIAEKYDFSKRQIERILKSYFSQRDEGVLYPEFKRKSRCDRKRKRGKQGKQTFDKITGLQIKQQQQQHPSIEDDDEDTDSQPEIV